MATNWLKEEEAADKVGLAPRTLRRYAKSGKLNVEFRTLNRRNFQYKEQDLEKVFTVHRSAK